MILRAAAALQDRYARFRLRKYRPYVLAAVVAYMIGRRAFR